MGQLPEGPAAPSSADRRSAHLRRLLAPGAIDIRFEPVVRLADGACVGYAARPGFPAVPGLGPMPAGVTFSAADAAGLRAELDAACWAATTAAGAAPGGRFVVLDAAAASVGAPALATLATGLPPRAVISISGPLADPDALRAVLAGLDRRVPVLLKIAPDLTDAQVDAASDVAAELADGIVATNTTTGRAGLRTPGVDALGPGGVSGPPVRPRALEVVARIFRRHEGRLPIVGVGGIASSADAWAHLRAGATAVQLYTGLVYGGPGVARAINRGLLARLEAAGLTSITEVVGLGA